MDENQDELELESEQYKAIDPINYTDECLSEIGIDLNTRKITKGFIKLYPRDFIVEEIGQDEKVSTITPNEANIPDEAISNAKLQIEFDLVKIGMATFEAKRKIAETLDLSIEDIKTAGLKDSKAITSQKAVISNRTKEEIKKIELPQIILKNIRAKKGTLNTGELIGNRFTILVRTEKKENKQLIERIGQIQTEGFLNFFSLQRFGTRLISHKIGQAIVNNDCERAANILLFTQSNHECKIYREIRTEAEKKWRDWSGMKELFSEDKAYFAAEFSILTELESGSNFFQAFKNQEWTTKIFVHAFTSYYFNKLLSTLNKAGAEIIPEKLPFLCKNQEILDYYKKYLPNDDTNWQNILEFSFDRILSTDKKGINSKIVPKVKHVIDLPIGYLFVFDLDKGAYATTFLSNFFELIQYNEQPDWLNQDQIDTLKLVGRESVFEIEEKLNRLN